MPPAHPPSLPPPSPPPSKFFLKLEDDLAADLYALGRLRGETVTVVIRNVLRVFGRLALQQELERTKAPGLPE